jgi:hypothetical protein
LSIYRQHLLSGIHITSLESYIRQFIMLNNEHPEQATDWIHVSTFLLYRPMNVSSLILLVSELPSLRIDTYPLVLCILHCKEDQAWWKCLNDCVQEITIAKIDADIGILSDILIFSREGFVEDWMGAYNWAYELTIWVGGEL